MAVRTLDELEAALDGAALLGLELDTRYRVLAATLEPVADHPWGQGSGVDTDRRVQLLVSPVATILGSLRRRTGERAEVLRFDVDQLVEVAGAFDGAALDGPLFGRSEPRPGSWAPQWSLEGRSSAPDGTSRTLTVSVRHDADGEDLALDLFARFDEVQVNDATGQRLLALPPPGALDLGL